jgi:hypothetical protein
MDELYTSFSRPGVALECLLPEEHMNELFQITPDIDELVHVVEQSQPNLDEQHIPGTDSLVMWYDWNSDSDFGDHLGGSYIIIICNENDLDDRDYRQMCLYIYVEWDDDYMGDLGLREERSDETKCLAIGMESLFEWMQNTLR